MKRFMAGLTLVLMIAFIGLAYAQSQGYIVFRQGAKELTVKSGGKIAAESGGLIDVESGGEIDINAGGTLDINGGITTPVAITSAYDSLTVAESGRTIIGRPLAAKTNFILPPAASGLQYTFYIVDADSGRIVAATGDSIIAADGSASKVTGTVAGSVTVKAADTTRWFMLFTEGTWTASAN